MSRLHQTARALLATLLTLLLVVGVPAVLIRYVGWPLPTSIPTLDEVQLALRSGIDPQLVINTLAAFVWLLWFQLVAALVVEIAAVIRGRTARVLPVLPGMQHAAARLVATIALIAAGLAPLRAPAALALPTQSVASVAYTPTLEPANEPDEHVVQPSRPQIQQTHVSYTTRHHETAWGIAERTLGDGRRWHEIRQLNPEQVTTDGAIETGIQLRLPDDADIFTPEILEVTVERGDHFWSLSEDALTKAWGRPPTNAEIVPYWKQVIESNRERLAPPYDPSLIYPGQVFHLPTPPDDPQGPPTSVPATPEHTGPGTEVTVESGDNLWTISETALTGAWGRKPTNTDVTAYWRQVIAVNGDRLVDATNPSHILPGQTFELPAFPADPTTAAPDPAQPVDEPQVRESQPDQPAARAEAQRLQPEARIPGTPEPRPEPAPIPAQAPTEEPPQTSDTVTPQIKPDFETEEDEAGWFPAAAGLAGLGVVAAGLITLIDRLRRRQLQHRQPNRIPTPPSAEATTVEANLRSAASVEGVEFVDIAMRALGRQILDHHLESPHLVGVHLSDAEMKVLLWTPHPNPPPGWTTEDEDTIWCLPTTTDVTHLRLLSDGTPSPYPTLVTAGYDSQGQLLIDLEFLGAITITGASADVMAACRTIAVELAASPIADQIEVICIGFGTDLADLERITVVDTPDEALLGRLDERINVGGPEGAVLEARLGPGGDSYYPVVVIDPSPDPLPGAARILAVAQSGRGIAAVVGYPTGDRWQLRLDGSTATVEPLGLTLDRRDLTPAEQNAVAELVSTAKDLEGIPAPPVIATAASNGHHPSVDTDATPMLHVVEAPPEELEVRVLGTIRINGLEGRFPSRKAAELPVYLAFHRDGAEADTLMEALWPGEAPDYNRLNRTTSRARSTLGASVDGEPYIPPFSAGLYRASTRLGCDLERFTSRLHAAKQPGADELTLMRSALELVEGTPFSGGGNGYTWAWAEGLVSHAIVAVDDTAHRLATAALETGDSELAAWAARKGLLSTTRCEECYRNLMRAAIAQNNKTALDAIFTELTTVIDSDDGPDAIAYLDPETIQLYEANARNRQPDAPRPGDTPGRR